LQLCIVREDVLCVILLQICLEEAWTPGAVSCSVD